MASDGQSSAEDSIASRLSVFVKKFVLVVEDKLSQCQLDGQIGATPESGLPGPVSTGAGLAAGTAVGVFNPSLAPMVTTKGKEVTKKIFKAISGGQKKAYSRTVLEIFRNVPKDTRFSLMAEAAGALFESFECPFMCVSGEIIAPASWALGLEKLAVDAVDRLFSNLVNSKEITLTVETVFQSVLNGESNTAGLVRSVLPNVIKNKVHATKPGYTICMNGKEHKTSDVYDRPGILLANTSGSVSKVYTTRKKGNQIYRKLLSFESNEVLIGCVEGSLDINYVYRLNRDQLREVINKILMELRRDDGELRSRHVSSTIDTVSQQMETYKGAVEQHFAVLNRHLEGKSNFEEVVSFVREFIHKSSELDELNWRSADEVNWAEVVRRILLRCHSERKRGNVVARYICRMQDRRQISLEVIRLRREVYNAHFGSIVFILNDTIQIKKATDIRSRQLEQSIRSQMDTSLTIIVGPSVMEPIYMTTENVVLLVLEDECLLAIADYIKVLANYQEKPLKWPELLDTAKEKLKSRLQLSVKNQLYTTIQLGPDIFDFLEGNQLNKILKEGKLDLFSVSNLADGVYVPRWLQVEKIPRRAFTILPNVYYLIESLSSLGLGNSLFFESDVDFFSITAIDANVIEIGQCSQPYRLVYDKMKQILKNETFLFYTHAGINYEKLIRLLPDKDIVNNMKNKVIFISAGAGEGKTEFLNYLQSCQYKHGTISIRTSAEDLIERCEKSSYLLHDVRSFIAKTIFEFKVTERLQIVLLIDALDELETSKMIVFGKIITELTQRPEIHKVVVTMRSYLEPVVKQQFPNATICSFLDMKQHEKKAIVESCLKKDVAVWDEQSNQSCARLVDPRQKRLAFVTTPLLCTFLAESYLSLDATGVIKISPFNTEINILEMIISKKFQRYLTEKVGVSKNNKLYQKAWEDFIQAHVYLGMKELGLNEADNLAAIKPDHVPITLEQGFLDSIDPVHFGQRRFAEYFVDKWVYEVLITNNHEVSRNKKFANSFEKLFCERYLSLNADVSLLIGFLKQHVNQVHFHLSSDTLAKMMRRQPDLAECMFLRTPDITEPDPATGDVVPRRQALVKQFFSSLNSLVKYTPRVDVISALTDANLALLVPGSAVEINKLLNSFKRGHIPNFLHIILRDSCRDEMDMICAKKAAIDLLLEKEPRYVRHQNVYGDTPVLCENTSIALIFHLLKAVERAGIEPSCSQLLLQTNYFRKNLVHQYRPKHSFGFNFASKLVSEFPQEFYLLANSVDCNGKPAWLRFYEEELRAPVKVLHGIDFCIRNFDGRIESYLSPASFTATISVVHFNNNKRKSAISLLRRQHEWKDFLNRLETGLVIGPEVAAKLKSKKRSSLLNVFRICVAEAVPLGSLEIQQMVSFFPCENELWPFYVASYVANSLQTADPGIEPIILKLLTTAGISFQYAICVHLLNDMIANFVDKLSFNISAEKVQAMCMNDSPFVVACKTGHVNIAKLLFKSFCINWVQCLSEFQVMCFFRALDQHCGSFIDEVVEKLVDHNYQIPVFPVHEALITGNLKLFSIYSEKLDFTKVNELHANNGFVMLHKILENSMFPRRCVNIKRENPGDQVIQQKKQLMEYILHRFPSSLEARDGQGRTPLLSRRQSCDLTRWLIENGADVDAVDNQGNTLLHILFGDNAKWMESSSQGQQEVVQHACYLAKCLDRKRLNAKNSQGLTEIDIGFPHKKILKLEWLEQLKVAGFNVDGLKIAQVTDEDYEISFAKYYNEQYKFLNL